MPTETSVAALALGFDPNSAYRMPIPGLHWGFQDCHTNQCVWVVGNPRWPDFLVNIAALDYYKALPTSGTKYIRFQGSSANIDRMMRLDDLKFDPNDIFPALGDKGPAYRVRFGETMTGPTRFIPPANSDIPF